jgi:hypothetical protein
MPEPTPTSTNKLVVIGAGQPLTVPLYSWWREVATRRTFVCIGKGRDDAGRWRCCRFLEFARSEPFEWDYAALGEAVEAGTVERVVPPS